MSQVVTQTAANDNPMVTVVETEINGKSAVLHHSKSNPTMGWLRVEQGSVAFNDQGFLQANNRTAFLKGDYAQLEKLIEKNGIAAGYQMPGKIIVQERAGTPFYKGQQPKLAGSTGVTCVDADGGVIYRQTTYTPNPEATDTLVAHANTEEIKAARVAQAKPDAGIKK